MSNNEIYVSAVVETTGPVPDKYAMLGLACAAIGMDGEEISTIELGLYPGTYLMHQDNEAYWKLPRNAGLKAHLKQIAQHPVDATHSLISWIRRLPGRAILTSYQIGYTYMWLNHYISIYAPPSPFGVTGLDLKSMAYMVTSNQFWEISRKDLPDEWMADKKVAKTVLDKARKQADILRGLLAFRREISDTCGMEISLKENSQRTPKKAHQNLGK